MKQVPNELGRELAEKEGMMFSGECSAKNNTNIRESINKFIVMIYDKKIKAIQDGRSKIKEDKFMNKVDWLKQAPEERKRKEQNSN